MKIHILSDLHLEFSDRHPPLSMPDTGADVVVIAGDIDNDTRAFDWAERMFPAQTVLYVPGNHEYYGYELARAADALRERAAQSRNVRLLDNDATVIDGVRFLGSTLWTDFELFGRERIDAAFADSLKHVVDFRAIRSSRGRLLTPQDTIELHRAARDFLERGLAEPFDGPTVVISHHAPHGGSLHPRWAKHLSSAAFVSDLTALMGKPALWVHGHTHDGFDYTVDGTRVIANPMGYRTSNWWESRVSGAQPWVRHENAAFDIGLTVEVDRAAPRD
jgi:Icc-related predicted phosphoesterase